MVKKNPAKKDYDKILETLNVNLEKMKQKCKDITREIEKVEAEKQQYEMNELLREIRANNMSINDVRELLRTN